MPIHWLGVDDDWTEAPELGMLGPGVQPGLVQPAEGADAAWRRCSKGVTLANYQETKIRHFHHLLDQYIGA